MTTPDFPSPPDRVAVRRALLSVSDKSGLVEMAARLVELGVELVSTGGTRAALAAAGLPVMDVADTTGFPEMMDGRVKTLHPKVHGALLAVRNHEDHARAMSEHQITGIDLVYVNLYPFEATLAQGGSFEACIENIDIGGPAMLRSAAKNHGFVAVCTEPSDLAGIIEEIAAGGGTCLASRRRLAAKTYLRTAAYDACIANWFATQVEQPATNHCVLAGQHVQTLRYGENPHQTAAFFRTGDQVAGVATARQLQGKALSYNNICDTDAAIELVSEFAEPACVIIKHANPCGVATADTPLAAYQRALACDPVSAFGGIVALNRRLDATTAAAIAELFTEVVIAPDADEMAISIMAAKKNLRLLLTGSLPDPARPGQTFRSVTGGILVQSRDQTRLCVDDLKVVTERQPTSAELEDMLFAFSIAKHVKSNAIVFARSGQTLGIGAGQMNRKDSARIAAMRAADFNLDLMGSACASEAFFPFADGLIQAAKAGATAVIQPGGSMRDAEVIAAANAHGLAMVFTGRRVFRH